MLRKSSLINSLITTVLAIATTSTTTIAAAGGTDILHFSDRASFTNNGVLNGASGNVLARENKQGNADNESVSLSLKGLDTNAPYTLQITTVDDTNVTAVSDFTTDSKGRANLNFRNQGNGHGMGRGKLPLPDAMDPVSALRTLTVADTNSPILTADLTAPTQLQYLIKRNLSTNDVVATLRIQANNKSTRLRLSARGLPGTNDYYLAFNGGIVQTNSTDSHGRLEMGSALISPTDILDLRTVTVLDTASNVVVTTTLP